MKFINSKQFLNFNKPFNKIVGWTTVIVLVGLSLLLFFPLLKEPQSSNDLPGINLHTRYC